MSFYVLNKKEAIAFSTKATSDFLAVVHEMYPEATIAELKDILSDKTQWIFNPEAIAVLDAHIKHGYGSSIPHWR